MRKRRIKGKVMGRSGAEAVLADSNSVSLWEDIRSQILDEYRQDHNFPWIIGYSGGKDSTLVTHLVIEMMMRLPPSERKRAVHIVANDTLVESPLVVQHIIESSADIADAALAFGLPVVTKITRPAADQTFWVNLIGRGYPSPNRSFRWCTDRMKIQPTSHYIRSQVDMAGQVILLLGVRRSESATRAASVGRYDNGERLNRHNDLTGCMVFRPIVELSTDDVWEFLALNDPPWGGSHRKLIGLYRNASGGECPVITQKTDAPSCGTTSSRFGCWTCTVVEKDRSLEGFVESGFTEFGPLLDFRDWLASIRNDKERRQARRRDGRVTITDSGTFVPGPFTLSTRNEILERLHALEEEMGYKLVSEEEIRFIHEIWAEELTPRIGAQSMSVREKRLSLLLRFADILCRGSRLKRFGYALTETAVGHHGWRGSAQIVPKVDFSKGGARAETHFGRSVRQAADARISESVAGTTLTAIPRRLSKAER